MTVARTTRRDFLTDVARSATAGGLALQLPLLTMLASCARDAEHFKQLTPAEARTMRAFAAQILPSESSSPGAEEAGAVYFIDQAFGHPFFADTVRVVRAGLDALDRRASSMGARNGFASLSSADQATVMRSLEREPFFAAARTLVLIGTFADPSHGGNRGGVGLKMMRIDHQPSYTAPFGWYDATTDADCARFAT